jgi:hypothetical protein
LTIQPGKFDHVGSPLYLPIGKSARCGDVYTQQRLLVGLTKVPDTPADEVRERGATRSLYPEGWIRYRGGQCARSEFQLHQERNIMSLSILNNIAALYAQNNINST